MNHDSASFPTRKKGTMAHMFHQSSRINEMGFWTYQPRGKNQTLCLHRSTLLGCLSDCICWVQGLLLHRLLQHPRRCPLARLLCPVPTVLTTVGCGSIVIRHVDDPRWRLWWLGHLRNNMKRSWKNCQVHQSENTFKQLLQELFAKILQQKRRLQDQFYRIMAHHGQPRGTGGCRSVKKAWNLLTTYGPSSFTSPPKNKS